MKKWRKGKTFAKAISVLAAISLICAPIASAEITLDPTVTATDVTLTVECGAENAGKNVVVQVFEPTGKISDLLGESGIYDVTDAAKIDEALCCIYQGVLNASGELTFTFAPTGDKGLYAVRVAVEGIASPTDGLFVSFKTDGDAAAILAELALNPTADAVGVLFEKSDNVNVYKPYQLLELDESDFYETYDSAGASVKAKIHQYLAAGVAADTSITPAEFKALFDDVVLVESVNVAQGDALADYIEEHAATLGLATKKEYKDIYEDSDLFDEKVKAAFLTNLAEVDLSGKTPAQAADAIAQEIFVALVSNTDSPGLLDSVINDFKDELEAAGTEMEEYLDSDKPIEICRELIKEQPFDSLADFADKLNDKLPSGVKEDKEAESPSRGGSGGGGGGYVFRGDEADITTNEAELAFSDIANVSWAQEAIKALKASGIISGRPNGTFGPNDPVTREEFVKMLVLSLGLSDSDKEPAFADMSGNEWFAPYVRAAHSAGIVAGKDGKFGVGEKIIRQDMAVMCQRALDAKGAALATARSGMTFTDSISDYAKDAVNKLYSSGLLNGLSETEFGATGTTTRAQAAKLLYEVIKAIS